MKYLIKIIFLFIFAIFTASCASYLDIVPEGDATLETAFSNRVNTEKYLFTCYTCLPNPTDVFNYPAMIGGDEIWWNYDQPSFQTASGTFIAKGAQEANDPYLNFWDGSSSRAGNNTFQSIRICNIFLENVNNPHDIDEYERAQWIAEVKFLKAYFHFFLLQLYGPIPIMKENLPVNATPDEVRLYRDPVDDVVNYIVQLLDEAVPDLPMEVLSPVSDAGRATKPIALALKAKALVLAASPLFNGNPDYAGFKDNKERQLISSGSPDPAKWQRAAVAIKNAIDTCHLGGHSLYEFIPNALVSMSPQTQLKYRLRGAVTERFNSEIIWADVHDVLTLQRRCMPLLEAANYNTGSNEYCATLKVAEEFYTENGLPIDKDPTWDYAGRYSTQKAEADHQYYIRTGETTAKLNFRREPRFYSSLGFDRGVFEGAGRLEGNSFYIQGRQGEASGMRSNGEHSVTGYQMKKLLNLETAFTSGTNTFNQRRYSYPLIRLTDLFLLYAEALNEAGGATPSAEVFKWIDTVRHRAGIPGVKESYSRAAPQYRDEPNNKETLREIIKRERMIELAFEGQRFHDLRRWKDAFRYFNEPVRGWNFRDATIDGYYTITNVWDQRVFNLKDYLWPLKTSSVILNSNLEQNPGW
jgi:hypothetical protein